MDVAQIELPARPARRLVTSIVERGEEVREAQRLRYRVFAEECGARLATTNDALDEDAYDIHCAHVLVRDEQSDQVIGTYRILTGEASLKTGGFYSEAEFDLDRLLHLRPRIAELGRSCVHPDYRTGAVVAMLWNGIAEYVAAKDCDILIGCASVPMTDGGHAAATIYRHLSTSSLAPLEYRAMPRTPIDFPAMNASSPIAMPPLIKGYIRAGAWLCGHPHWDPDFNTADFLMMLQLDNLERRYARHYGANVRN